jgi:hypothetical protein
MNGILYEAMASAEGGRGAAGLGLLERPPFRLRNLARPGVARVQRQSLQTGVDSDHSSRITQRRIEGTPYRTCPPLVQTSGAAANSGSTDQSDSNRECPTATGRPLAKSFILRSPNVRPAVRAHSSKDGTETPNAATKVGAVQHRPVQLPQLRRLVLIPDGHNALTELLRRQRQVQILAM